MANYLNLLSVAAVLHARGWTQAADLPLSDFVDALTDAVRARTYLRQLVVAGGCPKVAGLLDQPLIAQQLRHQLGLAGEAQLATALAVWLERRALGLKGHALAAAKVAAIVQPPSIVSGRGSVPGPRGPTRLQATMTRQELASWIGDSPWRRIASDLTVRDLALPMGTPLVSKGYMPDYTTLGDLLCDFTGRSQYTYANSTVIQSALQVLEAAARGPELAAATEQQRLDRPLSSDPEIANLQQKLLNLRMRLRSYGEPRPPALARQRVAEVSPESRRITVSDPDLLRFCTRHTYGATELVYRDEPGEFGVIAGTCQGNCAVALAAVDAALDATLAPTAPLRKLAHAITVPAWALLFEQMDSLVQAHEKTAERADRELLGWRVDLGESSIECEPVWVGTDRKGQLRLKKAPLSTLRGDPALCSTDADRRLIELPLSRREVRIMSAQAAYKVMGTILRALAGHPRLFRPNDDPLRVAQAEVGLELRPVAGGAQWHVAVGSKTSLLQGVAQPLVDGAEDLVLEHKDSIEVAPMSVAVRRLLLTLQSHPILPSAAVPALLQRLPQLARLLPVAVPAALRGENLPASRLPVLKLEVVEGGALQIEARVRPLPDSPLLTPGQGATEVYGQQGELRVWAERDLPAELQALAALWAKLELPECKPGEPVQLPLETGLDLTVRLELLADDEARVLWMRERRQTRRAETQHLRVELRDRIDWFGVDGTLQVGDAQVDLPALLQAIRERRKYVQVSGGMWLQLGDELRQRLERAADAVATDRTGLVLSPLQADALEGLLQGEPPQRWQNAVQAMRVATQLAVVVPPGLQATLRTYQQEGVYWLLRLAAWAPGAVLADDMGLGKTVQALALLLDRRDKGPALVVAPTSVESNWLREAATFAPGLKFSTLRQSGRKPAVAPQAGEVLVVSYDLLVRNTEQLQAVHWATLVCDEAQAIKNSTTQRFKAVMGIDAEFRLGLTGTPVENHTGELWAVLTAMVPGLLGPWTLFQQRFAGPIERDGDAKARAALARVLRPFVLRRLKTQVAQDLPPRTEVRVDVEPSPAERALYQQVRQAALQELEALTQVEPQNKRFQVLAAITRLRQVACHPRLLDDQSQVPSAKLAHVLDILTELREEGHRALVFSQFVRHLALLCEQLDKAGISYRYLDGSTPEPQRRKEVAAFQAGQGDAFLISLKAGGTGLNLTAADYVLHLDPWWNPAVEDQATDRAHRIGQLRPVTVYRLVATGTIEESILALHERKRELVAGLLEGTGEAAQLSMDQLIDLLRESTQA